MEVNGMEMYPKCCSFHEIGMHEGYKIGSSYAWTLAAADLIALEEGFIGYMEMYEMYQKTGLNAEHFKEHGVSYCGYYEWEMDKDSDVGYDGAGLMYRKTTKGWKMVTRLDKLWLNVLNSKYEQDGE